MTQPEYTDSGTLRACRCGSKLQLKGMNANGNWKQHKRTRRHRLFFTSYPDRLSPEYQRFCLMIAELSPNGDALTPREVEIAYMMIVDLNSNTAVAAELQISTKTVESHKAHILTKLNLGYPGSQTAVYLLLQTEYAYRRGRDDGRAARQADVSPGMQDPWDLLTHEERDRSLGDFIEIAGTHRRALVGAGRG